MKFSVNNGFRIYTKRYSSPKSPNDWHIGLSFVAWVVDGIGTNHVFEILNLFLLPFQEWDDTLADLAQGLADTCVFKHTNLKL